MKFIVYPIVNTGLVCLSVLLVKFGISNLTAEFFGFSLESLDFWVTMVLVFFVLSFIFHWVTTSNDE
ncbi:hypothetical protein ACYRFS_03205 [Listeria kieliensis]